MVTALFPRILFLFRRAIIRKKGFYGRKVAGNGARRSRSLFRICGERWILRYEFFGKFVQAFQNRILTNAEFYAKVALINGQIHNSASDLLSFFCILAKQGRTTEQPPPADERGVGGFARRRNSERRKRGWHGCFH